MMTFVRHERFKKDYKKLRVLDRNKCDERLLLFAEDPYNPILNNHALSGIYKGLRSINITGDFRALYQPMGKNSALFVRLDTHSNLYG